MTIQSKVDAFFTRFPVRRYKKGETLIQAGDKPKVFYITEGTVSQYDTSTSGDKLILNIYKPGSFLPLASALNSIPTDFAFEASDNLTVHVATASEVVSFLESSPDVVLDSLKRLSRGTNGVLKRMASIMDGSAEGRIIQELEIMEARFNSAKGLVISEVDIAAQTGLARETVNRTLKRMREKGIVSRANGYLKLNQ